MSAHVDFFELFGLPRRFAIEPAELEARYLARSRESHPDRAVGGTAEVRAAAAGQAMLVNQGYRALRRPLARAEHLLALEGISIGDNEPVGQELLLEILELREALAEARVAGDRAALQRLERVAREREKAEIEKLAAGFADLEAGTADRAVALSLLKAQVILLRYLARYREAFAEEDEEAASAAEGGGAG